MNQIQFWEFVHDSLQTGEPLMLLLVVASGGSSPGKPGFKMAVTLRGERHGTIGGGATEKDLVDKAAVLLSRGRGRVRLLKLLHREGPAGKAAALGRPATRFSGGICSGWQQVALLPLDAGDGDAVDSLLFALKRNRPGRLQLSPRGLEFQPGKRGGGAFTSRSAFDWTYREETGLRPTLTIIGGGHVGLALSRVMAGLDFHVRVLDDREELATMTGNVFAQEKHVGSFRSVGRLVEEGSMSYVVIMTYGHQADEKVLGQLVRKKLRYLGLLGSPAKNACIFANLEKKGISRRALGRVRAPVGLPIHSHTPEEIAISIAAEIIQEKNQPKLQ
jgi:xanthine dehydrogenase accessory factor